MKLINLAVSALILSVAVFGSTFALAATSGQSSTGQSVIDQQYSTYPSASDWNND